MRILYITQTFHPETQSVERLTRQALALRALGNEVTVLTTMPYYPLGRVFPGYRWRFFMRDSVEGLPIVRVWSLPAGNNGIVRRLLSYGTFALFATIAGLCLRRRDIVFAGIPHPGTELAGIIISRLKRIPLMLEVIDVLPDNLGFIGLRQGGMTARILSAYYRLAYRLSHVIAVLCASSRDVIAEKGIDPAKIILMPNGTDPELLNSIPPAEVRARHGVEGKFVVMYSGSFSPHYQVPNIVAAAAMLKARTDIHFLLLGEGTDWEACRRTVAEQKLHNVTLVGSAPRSEYGGYLQATDAFVYSMVADSTPRPYHGILTAKACDYLLVGKPIVAVERGDIFAPLLERIGAGVLVTPGDPAALADVLARYASDPAAARAAGAAAGEYAQRHLLRMDVMRRFMNDLAAQLTSPASAEPVGELATEQGELT